MYLEKLHTIRDLVNQLKNEKGKKNKTELLDTLDKYLDSSIQEYSVEEKTYAFTTGDLFVANCDNRYFTRDVLLGFASGINPLAALTTLLEDDPEIGTDLNCEEVNAYLIVPCVDATGNITPVEELVLMQEDEDLDPKEDEVLEPEDNTELINVYE